MALVTILHFQVHKTLHRIQILLMFILIKPKYEYLKELKKYYLLLQWVCSIISPELGVKGTKVIIMLSQWLELVLKIN